MFPRWFGFRDRWNSTVLVLDTLVYYEIMDDYIFKLNQTLYNIPIILAISDV